METSDSECFESADEEFYSDKSDNEKGDFDKRRAKSKVENTSKEGLKPKEKIVGCKKEIKNEITNKNSESVNDKIQESDKNDNMWEDDWNVEDKDLENSNNLKLKDVEEKVIEDLSKIEITQKIKPIKKVEIKAKIDSDVSPSLKLERKISLTRIPPVEKEINMWDNDDWTIEEEDNSIKDKKEEENLWENNWDDFEESDTLDTNTQDIKTQNIKTQDTKNDIETKNKDTKCQDVKSSSISKESFESNQWEDDWEPIENISKTSLNEPTEIKKDGWGSWGSWGLSSVISTATNITSQVSQSITTVLESGIGAPNPEELAKIDREIEKEIEDIPDEKPVLFGLGSLVQGVTKLVETTGTKVITGGLDTLETIGKKTMEVLQENDPGLKKKRAFLALKDEKPILSQILREAKEKAEQENVKKEIINKRVNYETLFDDYQGLVHLEALEMLSRQCDIKLSSLLEATSGENLIEMQETLEQIKELCELPEDEEEEIERDEIKEKMESSVKELNVAINYDKLINRWVDIENWLDEIEIKDGIKLNYKNIHHRAIESLAELTAIAVEQFHKGGELLLIKQHRSTADEADSLVQLTITLTALIGLISAKYSEKLNRIKENETDQQEINELITNIFFEAANSTTYIKDAFQLLIPVLQVGAV